MRHWQAAAPTHSSWAPNRSAIPRGQYTRIQLLWGAPSGVTTAGVMQQRQQHQCIASGRYVKPRTADCNLGRAAPRRWPHCSRCRCLAPAPPAPPDSPRTCTPPAHLPTSPPAHQPTSPPARTAPFRLYLAGRRAFRPSSRVGQSGLSTARSMSLSCRMRSPPLQQRSSPTWHNNQAVSVEQCATDGRRGRQRMLCGGPPPARTGVCPGGSQSRASRSGPGSPGRGPAPAAAGAGRRGGRGGTAAAQRGGRPRQEGRNVLEANCEAEGEGISVLVPRRPAI